MSVLIKDMEKPKSCYAVIDGEYEYCPFVNTDDDCVLLLKKGICTRTWQGQYSKCPLVEVTEPCEDAVSRKSILEKISKKDNWEKHDRYNIGLSDARQIVQDELSVTPKPISRSHENGAECEDAVSREAVIEEIKVCFNMGGCDCGQCNSIIEHINSLPPVTPKRKTMICGACLYCDSEALYVTNPTRIQCRKTGNLHFTTDYCDCDNENEKVRNMWEESDK